MNIFIFLSLKSIRKIELNRLISLRAPYTFKAGAQSKQEERNKCYQISSVKQYTQFSIQVKGKENYLRKVTTS